MTLTKDIAAKFAIAIVAVAMVLSAFAPVANAQTTEDLQKMINDLLAQVATLQSQVGQGATSVASGVCPYTWTRDLAQGATGADVMKLQQFLNADADTRVAAEGAGSVGMETEYYGPATAAAVSKMQVKYRAEILSPANLVNPTGYFGPSSRAKANAVCVVAPTTPTTPTTPVDGEEEEEEESVTLSGEASLAALDISSADEDEIEEGAEDAPVAEVTVEFEDGDAEISRLDVSIASSSVDSWDVLESVSLWVDGDMVAEKDASDEDDYQDEDTGTLRFSGLDIVAMEDEELDIIVAVTLQNNIDSDDMTTFMVSVNSIRFFDADGVATTEDADHDLGTAGTDGTDGTAEMVEFSIEEAGFEDEIIVKTSSNDPDSSTIQVEDNKKSDFVHVFSFDIDTDDSINDIELNEVIVKVATTGAAYTALVDDAELEIDGVTIDDFEVDVDGELAILTFDVDGDVTVDAGDRVEAKLMLRFKPLTVEGATVKASISGAAAVAGEGADDVDSTGAATGDTHTLRSTGVDVSADTDSAVVTVVDSADNDYATYKVVLDVTAFEQSVFIPINSASTTWKLVDGNGDDITTPAASTTVVVTSSAEEGGEGNAFFEINEGETETVTVTVTYTPGAFAPQTARLQLLTFVFDETGTTAKEDDETWEALPANDYRTETVSIQD